MKSCREYMNGEFINNKKALQNIHVEFALQIKIKNRSVEGRGTTNCHYFILFC